MRLVEAIAAPLASQTKQSPSSTISACRFSAYAELRHQLRHSPTLPASTFGIDKPHNACYTYLSYNYVNAGLKPGIFVLSLPVSCG